MLKNNLRKTPIRFSKFFKKASSSLIMGLYLFTLSGVGPCNNVRFKGQKKTTKLSADDDDQDDAKNAELGLLRQINQKLQNIEKLLPKTTKAPQMAAGGESSKTAQPAPLARSLLPSFDFDDDQVPLPSLNLKTAKKLQSAIFIIQKYKAEYDKETVTITIRTEEETKVSHVWVTLADAAKRLENQLAYPDLSPERALSYSDLRSKKGQQDGLNLKAAHTLLIEVEDELSPPPVTTKPFAAVTYQPQPVTATAAPDTLSAASSGNDPSALPTVGTAASSSAVGGMVFPASSSTLTATTATTPPPPAAFAALATTGDEAAPKPDKAVVSEGKESGLYSMLKGRFNAELQKPASLVVNETDKDNELIRDIVFAEHSPQETFPGFSTKNENKRKLFLKQILYLYFSQKGTPLKNTSALCMRDIIKNQSTRVDALTAVNPFNNINDFEELRKNANQNLTLIAKFAKQLTKNILTFSQNVSDRLVTDNKEANLRHSSTTLEFFSNIINELIKAEQLFTADRTQKKDQTNTPPIGKVRQNPRRLDIIYIRGKPFSDTVKSLEDSQKSQARMNQTTLKRPLNETLERLSLRPTIVVHIFYYAELKKEGVTAFKTMVQDYKNQLDESNPVSNLSFHEYNLNDLETYEYDLPDGSKTKVLQDPEEALKELVKQKTADKFYQEFNAHPLVRKLLTNIFPDSSAERQDDSSDNKNDK